MTGWLSRYSSDGDQANIEALRTKKPQEKGLFDGVGKEIVNAPVRAGVKVFAAGAEVADQVSDAAASLATDLLLPMPAGGWDETKPAAQTTDVAQAQDENRKAEAARIADQFTPKDSGAGAQVVGALIDQGATMVGATVATGNPITGAAVLGGSEGYNAYTQAKQDGVDDATAQLQGTARAATTMLGAVLPAKGILSGKSGAALAADAATTVGLSAAVGAAGRYAEQQILQGGGYDKLAKQYDPTDPVAIVTDLALGLGFWGLGRYTDSRRQLPLEQQDALTQVESQQQAADVSPVPLDTPNTANRHSKNLDLAEQAMKSGRPVNVPPVIHAPNPSAELESVPVEERKKLKYNSPQLDAYAAHTEQKYGLPSGVLVAIKNSGERSNSDQVSPAGAQGVMQFIPSTWATYGKGLDPTDPVHSIDAAGRFWADLIKQYDGNVLAAAAHYNGGTKQGRLVASGQRPSNAETAGYVDRIERHLGAMGKDVPPVSFNKAYTSSGDEIPFSYEVVSVNDLITSHNNDLSLNPLFPQELQPRDRTRAASVDQINSIANNLNPAMLGESPTVTDGAPIIGADNVVESGNARSIAIRKAYGSGGAENYKAYLLDNAERFGLSKSDILSMEQPVLVRRRVGEIDRVAFAQRANESTIATMSASERVGGDVARLPSADLLAVNQAGDVNIGASLDYIKQFVSALPVSERGMMMTSDGRLSQEGKRRIENAIVQQAYGDSGLVTRLSENMDDNSKNVLNALLKNAGAIAQLDSLVKQGGRNQNTIAADIAQAAAKYSDLKAQGSSVDDYFAQMQLVDDGMSAGAKEALQVFGDNSRSSKAISDYIKSKIDEVESAGDPRQGGLFGDTPEQQAALNLPDDLRIPTGELDADGNPITMTAKEMRDQLEAEKAAIDEQTKANDAAINCALQFGE